MITQEKWGVRWIDSNDKRNRNLINVSDCCSQIEGSDFDGPCLFNNQNDAVKAFELDTTDGAESYELVRILLTIDIEYPQTA